MLETMFRIPPTKLKMPDLTWRPPQWAVMGGMLFAFWLITGGIVYDMINQPPAVGQGEGPGGRKVAEGVMPRMQGQYFIEGLTGGFYYMMGGVGMILAHYSIDAPWAPSKR
ncbi:putative oligosaccharyltransferase complex subunit, partial [Diplonema papillatum]